ncbi:hypothetical protein CFOL_v3_07655, partial [Cephalotus follicularis]
MEEEEEIDRVTGEFSEERSSVFSQLKPYCIELLELVQNPKKHPSSIPSLLHCLRSSPPHALYPFFDYVLFPLLLLLDVAVDCRSSQKEDSKENISTYDVPKVPQKVSDRVVEGVLQCLEELLTKCHLGSVDQMVVVLKKLTFAALLSPSEASEEFREGVIKCFKTLLLGLLPCSDQSCSCKQITGLPELMESGNLQALLTRPSKHDSRPGECLLVFLQSQTASAAVGHWLSLLLKVYIEAARGHQGSAKLRIEAFMTLRILVAKVGIADALAFFLPGVVSQFAKVLHVSKTMISGAGGSVEATNQAIRGLAEYIMIVLQDDANLSSLDSIRTGGFNSDIYESTNSFLEELRKLPIKAQRESESVAEDVNGEVIEALGQKSENIEKKRTSSGKEIGTLHVNRTREWIQKTSSHLNKLFCATLPNICVHPAKQVRKGLLVALQGLLSRCSHTLKESRLMLLECLCVLVVDVFEEVSSASQEFLVYLFSSSEKHHIEHEVAEIFSRLIAKLPTVVLGNEESLALSHAQKLLVVMYYSGPQFVMDHIQSPVTAARLLDVFAVCLSQNASFTGSLDKVMIPRRSSIGYLHSIAELKPGSLVTGNFQTIINATSSDISKATDFQVKDMRYQLETMQKKYELPRMPPWFVGSQKLYLALSGILRLVGSSLTADFRSEGHLMVITDIPLGYLRRLVSEVRVKEYSNQSWKYWCDRTGSGQLIRQASTAACILNEMIFGLSDHAVDIFTRMFQKSRMEKEEVHESHMGFDDQPHEHEISVINKSMWKISQNKSARSLLIDCIGKILHEYLSPEVWNLPIDHKSYLLQLDSEVGDISLHFFCDIAMLHQEIYIFLPKIFALCLGKDFASSGFLHSSLYLLLEKLICSNFQVRSSSDAVLHVLAAASGYPTVGQLVLANADYVIDSICRQLRHLDLNPHVPNVLAAMLSYIGVAHKVLPLLEEPMLSVSQELEILGRHQHPDLTLSFLKVILEIVKASKHEAYCLPTQAKAYLKHVESKISYMDKNSKADFGDASTPHHDTSFMKPEQWEKIMFELNDSKRYRRTVGSIAGSCLIAATPLLASVQQAACLLALDIVENGIATLAKVEEAYRCETETKEKIEEVIQSYFLYELKDTLDAAQDGTDDNRLLPAMNKIWPFLVICIQNRNPVAATKCLSLVSSVVQICGGDFFSRRFLTDGPHFWNLLSTSPFQKKPRLKDEKMPLLLPYRSTSVSLEDSVAEVTHLKVQVALLNMIADLSRNQRSASALDAVLKKVSGLVVGIACSGVVGLQDASVNALHGLASIDPDLIWLLLADVYYSKKKKDKPPPPTSDLQDLSQILPPPLSQKEFLYVQYGGQTYGFDIDFSSVETVYKKMQSLVFTNQMY